jgi:DNA-binding HxlR family transcriptional regulator
MPRRNTNSRPADRYTCSIEATIDVIGGKWKVIILWHLREQSLRFSELGRLMPRITQKMLTQQLRELEADGVVRREVYAQVPPKTEYSLTDHGETLRPVLDQMCAWGARFMQRNGLLPPSASCD